MNLLKKNKKQRSQEVEMPTIILRGSVSLVMAGCKVQECCFCMRCVVSIVSNTGTRKRIPNYVYRIILLFLQQ